MPDAAQQDPVLTYVVGGSGQVNGDTLTGALATSATLASIAGDYAITQGSVTATPDYAVTYSSANLTVTPFAGQSASNVAETDGNGPGQGPGPRALRG